MDKLKFLLFAATLCSSFQSFAHYDNGYYHDSTDLPSKKNWMKGLNDSLPIRKISIPGTHDSGSFYGGDVVQTQSLSISQQLNAGVRFLDVRLRHIGDSFSIHHGPVYQHQRFGHILNDVAAFLAENPSETVLMRVKKEHTEEGNTRRFEDTFNDYYNRYSNIIWTPTSWRPNLGDTRGKIVFLQNFDSGDYQNFGLSYNSFDIQDEYSVTNNWALYSKWTAVKSHLNKAINSANNYHRGFINYLAASGGSFPYFIASGHYSRGTGDRRLLTGLTMPGWKYSYPDFPRVGCFIGICSIAFEGTNTLTKNFINQHPSSYVGIVVADFPGTGLIESVIKANY